MSSNTLRNTRSCQYDCQYGDCRSNEQPCSACYIGNSRFVPVGVLGIISERLMERWLGECDNSTCDFYGVVDHCGLYWRIGMEEEQYYSLPPGIPLTYIDEGTLLVLKEVEL